MKKITPGGCITYFDRHDGSEYLLYRFQDDGSRPWRAYPDGEVVSGRVHESGNSHFLPKRKFFRLSPDGSRWFTKTLYGGRE